MYLPYDIINADHTLWLLFIINERCLSDNPAVAAIASQEAISWCFRLTFVYDCWREMKMGSNNKNHIS